MGERKHAVVTGTTGLGLATAAGLAGQGWDITLAGRNAAAGHEAMARLRQASSRDLSFELLDLADLASVEDFANRLALVGRPIDCLVNSAGLIASARRETRTGLEEMFATNFLGHFALTGRLLPLLRMSADPRVVTVVGAAYKSAAINFDDLQGRTSFSAMKAGGQSMLAKVLFASELQRRSDANGWSIVSALADPGLARTELMSRPGTPATMKLVMSVLLALAGQSAEEGAQSAVMAATTASPVKGGYYAPSKSGGMKGPPKLTDLAESGKDTAAARRLWDVAQELAGRPFPA